MAPFYDVECEVCGREDVVMRRHNEANPRCEDCSGPMKTVLKAAPAAQLKGSGWAADGYATTEKGMQRISDNADRKHGGKRGFGKGQDQS